MAGGPGFPRLARILAWGFGLYLVQSGFWYRFYSIVTRIRLLKSTNSKAVKLLPTNIALSVN